MKIVLMGISGSGKSVIGRALEKKLHVPFYDGDDYHSKENKKKMHLGISLTDQDRIPWLNTLATLIKKTPSLILACSALKKKYRDILNVSSDIRFIYLKGNYTLIKKRLEKRKNHFFNRSLLQSQFVTLEEPEKALVIDISLSIDEITSKICAYIHP